MKFIEIGSAVIVVATLVALGFQGRSILLEVEKFQSDIEELSQQNRQLVEMIETIDPEAISLRVEAKLKAVETRLEQSLTPAQMQIALEPLKQEISSLSTTDPTLLSNDKSFSEGAGITRSTEGVFEMEQGTSRELLDSSVLAVLTRVNDSSSSVTVNGEVFRFTLGQRIELSSVSDKPCTLDPIKVVDDKKKITFRLKC